MNHPARYARGICFLGEEAVWLLGVLFLLAAGKLTAASNTGEVLVPPGSVWKYLDTGADLQTAWRTRLFNDNGWAEGPAILGYGETNEATTVSFGPDADDKYVTTYFRRSFVVPNATVFNRLTLSVLRDDGAVVYLNGEEVFRNNMPGGMMDYLTLASTNARGIAERTFYATNVAAALLLTGTNVLAVELHQAAPDSIDLSFDLQLNASNVVLATRGPYLQQGTPNSIVVRWRTQRPTDSQVRYGTNVAALNLGAADGAVTTEHSVKLTELSPDTRYYYTIGAADTEVAGGSDFSFVTAPTNAKPTRIWVIGDAGTQNANQRAVRDAYHAFAGTRDTDLWLMLGDNAYGAGFDYEYQAAVFDTYPELLRKTVAWTTIGNHETYSASDLDDFPYLNIFSPPIHGEAGGVASGTKKYYSFNYGNIHFVCLDSMTSDRLAGGPMLRWLQDDLAANTNTWLIAFWHHPPYTKGSHNSDDPFGGDFELVQMRQHALPILESYGVDLVLCGHSHIYERSILLNGHYGLSSELTSAMILDPGDGRTNGAGAYTKAVSGPGAHQGAVYVVAGCSGQVTFRTSPTNHPVMITSLLRLGSLVLDIDGNRLDAKFLRETGAIDDSFTILKGVPGGGLRLAAWEFTNGMVTLTWRSMPDKSYYVQRATNLEIPDWTNVSGSVPAMGVTTTWRDVIDPSGANKMFYRVLDQGQ